MMNTDPTNLSELVDWTKRTQFRGLKGKFVVYKITNIINDKVYIGITDWVNRRIGDHIRYSKQGYHKYKMYIHKAMSKYGFNNFTFEIIEVLNSRDELNDREQYWIGYYNTSDTKSGYNLTLGGNTNYPSEQTILKKIESSNKIKVAQYDLDGALIEQFPSIKEASRVIGISDSDIHRCHKRHWSRNGFMFRKYSKNPLPKIDPYVNNAGINLIEYTRGKLPHNAIKCSAINLKTKESYEANSLAELSNVIRVHKTTIFRILKNKKHKKWKIILQES